MIVPVEEKRIRGTPVPRPFASEIATGDHASDKYAWFKLQYPLALIFLG
jgi:hypothetical protein